MEKHSVTIKYGETAKELSKLSELIDSFNGNLGKFHVVRKTEKEVMESLNKLVNDRNADLKSEYNKVVEFFKTKKKKLWLMRITKGEGEYKFTDEKVIYVYNIREKDGYIDCLYSSSIVNRFKFGFDDGCIDIESLCYSMGETVIELEEITKEQAFEIFNKRINEVIDYRLEKQKEKEKGGNILLN